MNNEGSHNTDAIGFLTVVEHDDFGFFGGYLILNRASRPLEFHCTTPTRPNRAQQILYGPTLKPFLYGERIGLTLIEKSKIEPLCVLTDQEPALSLAEIIPLPVALVTSDRTLCDEISEAFAWGENRVAVAAGHESSGKLLKEIFESNLISFDLLEPFSRIREAIEEATRVMKAKAA